jgi:hypothetical protein
MNDALEESGLSFDFSVCGKAERYDNAQTNPYGMKSVDFLAESPDCLYFIEVKNFQNPNATPENRKNDYNMLVEAGTVKKSVFALEMGAKIKDSLLRRYASGIPFSKKVLYLLFIHLDKLAPRERGHLAEKINGHVPRGLNSSQFEAFTELDFDLVDAEGLEQYGIVATPLI